MNNKIMCEDMHILLYSVDVHLTYDTDSFATFLKTF